MDHLKEKQQKPLDEIDQMLSEFTVLSADELLGEFTPPSAAKAEHCAKNGCASGRAGTFIPDRGAGIPAGGGD